MKVEDPKPEYPPIKQKAISANETINYMLKLGFEHFLTKHKVPTIVKPFLETVIQPQIIAEKQTPDEIETFFRDLMQILMYAMDDEVSLGTFESQVALVILRYKK